MVNKKIKTTNTKDNDKNYTLVDNDDDKEQRTRKSYGMTQSIVMRKSTAKAFAELIPTKGRISKEKVLSYAITILKKYGHIEEVRDYPYYNRMKIVY